MKSYLMPGILFLLVLLSCENSSNEPTINEDEDPLTVTDYHPLSTGSYWVYNLYKFDSASATEELYRKNDTVTIIGDTVINGKTYAVFYGKILTNERKTKWFRRDSLNYIVNTTGDISFYLNTAPDTIIKEYDAEWRQEYVWMYVLEKYAGNYTQFNSGKDILNYKMNIYKNDDEQNFLGSLNNVYLPGIGNIIKQNTYMHAFETVGFYYETRLIEYNVKE